MNTNLLNDIENKNDKLWSFPLIILFIINVITAFSFCVTLPVVPKYLVSLGATLASAGAVAGAYALTALITRPFTGIIVDKFNNRLLFSDNNFYDCFVYVRIFDFKEYSNISFFQDSKWGILFNKQYANIDTCHKYDSKRQDGTRTQHV